MERSFGRIIVFLHVTINDGLQVIHVLNFDVIFSLGLRVGKVAKEQLVEDPLVHFFSVLNVIQFNLTGVVCIE